MKRTSLTLAAMFSIMTATIAHAQFGSGIVFDPTQSAHAITQIEHEEQSISNQVQQIENGQQIFSNTVKIASTALQTYNQLKQQYNLYHQMILAPRMLYSRFLSPTTDLRLLQQISWPIGAIAFDYPDPLGSVLAVFGEGLSTSVPRLERVWGVLFCSVVGEIDSKTMSAPTPE